MNCHNNNLYLWPPSSAQKVLLLCNNENALTIQCIALYIVPIQSLQSALNMKDFSAKYLALKAKAIIPNDLLSLNGELPRAFISHSDILHSEHF